MEGKKMKRFWVSCALMSLLTGLMACQFLSPVPTSQPAQTNIPVVTPTATFLPATPTQAAEITQAMLENFTYNTEIPNAIPLKNGSYQGDHITSNLRKPVAFGDLNGDGQKDAVVVLATNTGGSGTFFDLVAVLNQNGKPEEAAYVEFGDRQGLNNLQIADGRILLDYLTQGPGDGLCCPSRHVLASYVLENKALRLASYQDLSSKEAQATALPDLIFIDQPENFSFFSGPIEIKGRIEQTPPGKKLSYRVTDDLNGALLEQGEVQVTGNPGEKGTFALQINPPQSQSTILRIDLIDAENGTLSGQTMIRLLRK